MWQANILEKNFKEGEYIVIVSYTDNESTFADVYRLRAIKDIEHVITNRLRLLQENEEQTGEFPIGTFTPKPIEPEIITPIDPLSQKLFELRKLQDLVDLKVLDELDPKVIQARLDAKEAYEEK